MGFQKLVYCAQNSAKEKMLSKTAAIELAEKNIRVNTFLPGAAFTPIWDPLIDKMQMTKEEFKEVGGKMTLLGRMTNALESQPPYCILRQMRPGLPQGLNFLWTAGRS